MHLVMFDIDGTLTETMKVDAECFVRSLKTVFGLADINTDWSDYPRTTDSGIFHDVFTSRMGRSPTAQETSQFRQHFIQLLVAASSQSPFKPVAGADRLLSRLTQDGSHRVSLATGGWRESARLKMASAGMCYEDFPSASGDELWTESPLSDCPGKEQPSDMADLVALFTLETEFGMLVRVAALAFRSLALPRAVARHCCPQRELFASSLITVTRIYF